MTSPGPPTTLATNSRLKAQRLDASLYDQSSIQVAMARMHDANMATTEITE
jgi:hypothetical protein